MLQNHSITAPLQHFRSRGGCCAVGAALRLSRRRWALTRPQRRARWDQLTDEPSIKTKMTPGYWSIDPNWCWLLHKKAVDGGVRLRQTSSDRLAHDAQICTVPTSAVHFAGLFSLRQSNRPIRRSFSGSRCRRSAQRWRHDRGHLDSYGASQATAVVRNASVFSLLLPCVSHPDEVILQVVFRIIYRNLVVQRTDMINSIHCFECMSSNKSGGHLV